MGDMVFQRLRKHLDSFPSSFPLSEDNLEIRILKKILTEEEAEIAVCLPLIMSRDPPKGSRVVAQELGRDLPQVETLLQSMVKRGMVAPAMDEKGSPAYFLFPFEPGMNEFNVDHLDRELAEMIHQHMLIKNAELSRGKIPYVKVIPIERSLLPQMTIHPYEDIQKTVGESTSICIMNCVCRTTKNLMDEGCGRPVETCMFLNEFADHLLSIGKGRKVEVKEALGILKQAENAGCIHISSNSQGLAGLCSCCGCCCTALNWVIRTGNPSFLGKSDFELKIDPELCTGCEVCLDRCWFKALSMDDGIIAVDRERCLGCGACVFQCPTEALSMQRKPAEKIKPTPKDFPELLSRMGWRE